MPFTAQSPYARLSGSEPSPLIEFSATSPTTPSLISHHPKTELLPRPQYCIKKRRVCRQPFKSCKRDKVTLNLTLAFIGLECTLNSQIIGHSHPVIVTESDTTSFSRSSVYGEQNSKSGDIMSTYSMPGTLLRNLPGLSREII